MKKSISFEQKMNRITEELALSMAKKTYPDMVDIHYHTTNGITYISGANYLEDDNPMARYYLIALCGIDILYKDSNVVGKEHVNKGDQHADNLPPIVQRFLRNHLAMVEKACN